MKLILLSIVLVMTTIAATAQHISEVMYNLPPPGADRDREWIEIVNNTGAPLSLVEWSVFENGTRHRINEFQGGTNIPPGGVAVIADNARVFLFEHQGYTGIVFDSSFELVNTTNTITLSGPDGIGYDSVHYESNQGANGDGNSLQKISGEWFSHPPTPGEVPSDQQIIIKEIKSGGDFIWKITVRFPEEITWRITGVYLQSSFDLKEWTNVSEARGTLNPGVTEITFGKDSSPARFFRVGLKWQ